MIPLFDKEKLFFIILLMEEGPHPQRDFHVVDEVLPRMLESANIARRLLIRAGLEFPFDNDLPDQGPLQNWDQRQQRKMLFFMKSRE